MGDAGDARGIGRRAVDGEIGNGAQQVEVAPYVVEVVMGGEDGYQREAASFDLVQDRGL